MAFKITSATINETPLSQADPFVKMSVTAILSGMASKASGGDFVQGVMSAMAVWLYNDWRDENDYEARKKFVLQQAKELLKDPKVLSQEDGKYAELLKEFIKNTELNKDGSKKIGIIYVEHLYTTATSKNNQQVTAEFFGVTAANFKYIKIGGKCFRYWANHKYSELNIKHQIKYTILHELTHVKLKDNNHYVGFDDPIREMGYGGTY